MSFKSLRGGPMRPFVHSSPQISLRGAQSVIEAAHRVAEENGWHIAVAVVDPAGDLVAFERADAAIGITPEVAIGKARTAAKLQAPSGEFEGYINGGKPSFIATPGVVPLEGGMPIHVDGEFVGAVGVSGAHGPNDTQVAEMAAAALAR